MAIAVRHKLLAERVCRIRRNYSKLRILEHVHTLPVRLGKTETRTVIGDVIHTNIGSIHQ